MTAAVTEQPQMGPGPLLAASQVEHARQDLRDDADWLCTTQGREVEFDDGSRRYFTAPAPLTQVEQEITGGGAPVGSFAPHSKPPAGIDALTLLAAIDQLTARPPTRDRAGWVWSWAQDVASAAPGHVVDGAKTLGAWRTSVENLLDPKPRFRLRGQRCPSCGAEKVWDRADEAAGENHARPALEVDPDTGACSCLCCSASWAPELFEHLRGVLEQQREETLAAGGHDPTVTARTSGEASVSRLLAALRFDIATRAVDDGVATDDEEKIAAGPAPAVPVGALPEHAPRLRVGDVPVQCAARVVVIVDGEPKRRPDGSVVDQRCPALLNVEGNCDLVERHLDVSGEADYGTVPGPDGCEVPIDPLR